MQRTREMGLENALQALERDVAAALSAAEGTVKALRSLRAAVSVGKLRDIRASLDSVDRALLVLQQQYANTKDGWNFDEDAYFAEGMFVQELIAEAARLGVNIFERDDRLYCYPMLLRVVGRDRTVLIDKKRETRLRPKALARHLKDVQSKPPRFSPSAFLESIYRAYQRFQPDQALAERRGSIVPLLDIYELLTLFPGQRSDYSEQEFARDIYLLDRSANRTSRDGSRVRFLPPDRQRRYLSVIREDGAEQKYWGIVFERTGGRQG